MTEFTPVSALLGGGMIGLAASLLLLCNGRIAGISGIFEGALRPRAGDWGWRFAFIAGLLGGGVAMWVALPGHFGVPTGRTLPVMVLAGLLVGAGTRWGNGCTSGHGVCGLTRFSPRSLVATVTFIATAMITVLVYDHLLFGGAG